MKLGVILCKNKSQSWIQVSNDSERVIALCDHHSHGATSQVMSYKCWNYCPNSINMDGACMDNGKANLRCGAGVWFRPEDPRNLAIRIPGNQQSNQVGEVAAILAAIRKVQHFSLLKIITDSRYAKDGLTMHLQH